MRKCSSIGKVLFTLPFIVFGVMHLINGGQMAGMVPAFIPGGVWWVYATGVLMILAALAILADMHAKKAALALAALMLAFIVFIHVPGVMDPMRMQMALGGLLKDAALMGGALILAASYGSRGGACACGADEESCCGGDCGGCGEEK